jgi:hypothetical protein
MGQWRPKHTPTKPQQIPHQVFKFSHTKWAIRVQPRNKIKTPVPFSRTSAYCVSECSLQLLMSPLSCGQQYRCLTLISTLLMSRCPTDDQLWSSPSTFLHFSEVKLFGLYWNFRRLSPRYAPASRLSSSGSSTEPNNYCRMDCGQWCSSAWDSPSYTSRWIGPTTLSSRCCLFRAA